MGERYDIVVDFASFKGQNITVNNARRVTDCPDYAATDLVMRFVVGTEVTDDSNNGPLPDKLRDIPYAENKVVADKDFTFSREDDKWVINGVGFSDVRNRILARPKQNTTEKWVLKNGGKSTHPVHIHLVDFQVLSRTGERSVLPYEAAGMKDTVYLEAGEYVQIGVLPVI